MSAGQKRSATDDLAAGSGALVALVRTTSPEAAAIVACVLDVGTADQWIEATHEHIKNGTGIKRSKQDKAIACATGAGIMSSALQGIPARRHIKVHGDAINSIVRSHAASDDVENRQTSLWQRSKQDRGSAATRHAGMLQCDKHNQMDGSIDDDRDDDRSSSRGAVERIADEIVSTYSAADVSVDRETIVTVASWCVDHDAVEVLRDRATECARYAAAGTQRTPANYLLTSVRRELAASERQRNTNSALSGRGKPGTNRRRYENVAEHALNRLGSRDE